MIDALISSSEALSFGEILYSLLISFAIGAVIIIAIVLLAVAMSTPAVSALIPSLAPLFVLIWRCTVFNIQSTPPLNLTREPIQLTIIEIIVISYIEVIPFPIQVNISIPDMFPVVIPAIRERIVPIISTVNTFIPHNAPANTKI